MRVLISGAGIAGPTLAYWLRRRGAEAVLVERAPHFRTGGYVIDFWGVGYGVAEKMGLLPALREQGYLIESLRYVRKDGRVRAALRADAVRRALDGSFVSIRRGDLARAIYDLIEGEVEVIFGDTITALKEDDLGVEVMFERAAARRFDVVVGCDGLHSTVRRLAFGPQERFETYLGYFTASFASPGYPHRDAGTYVSYTAPGRQISRYALRGDVSAFFFVWTPERKPAWDPHDLDGQKRLLAAAFSGDSWTERAEIFARLAAADELYFDAVSQIRMPAWSKGRVVLVGDAARCPSLLAGEGSSLAMAGAFILAGELARAPGGYEEAFAAYERVFRPFIEAKQGAARRFAGSFAPRSRPGIFVRDQLLKLMNVPVVGDWLLRRLVADHFELPVYRA